MTLNLIKPIEEMSQTYQTIFVYITDTPLQQSAFTQYIAPKVATA